MTSCCVSVLDCTAKFLLCVLSADDTCIVSDTVALLVFVGDEDDDANEVTFDVST